VVASEPCRVAPMVDNEARGFVAEVALTLAAPADFFYKKTLLKSATGPRDRGYFLRLAFLELEPSTLLTLAASILESG